MNSIYYFSFEKRVNVPLIRHFFKLAKLLVLDTSAQSVVCKFTSIFGDAGTGTPTLFTRSTSNIFNNSAFCVTCALKPIRRSNDLKGQRHRQLERHTKPQRADKHSTSIFPHGEGKTTTAFDCLFDKFTELVM